MTAFLFDEDHPDADSFFGPQFASFIVRALETISNLPAIRIFRGSLLHTKYCYDLSRIDLREKRKPEDGISFTSSSRHMVPNYDLLLTIVCDLAETMTSNGSNMSESELRVALARKNIWTVVTQGIDDEYRSIICKRLEGFGPFLGWVKIDWSNPVQMDLFYSSLFHDMFISKDGLFKSVGFGADDVDIADEESFLKEYGSNHTSRALNQNEFDKLAPKAFDLGEPNERALLSVKRVSGKTRNHRTKIAEAILENFEAAAGFRTFSTSVPDDDIEFTVPEAKLTRYILNLDHSEGGAKARFFRDKLGIIEKDWRFLADQLCQAAPNSEFYRLRVTEYGVIHGALVLISGRNGQQAVVESGWKLGEVGPAQLVTAYPGDESKLETLVPFQGRVPEVGCKPPEKWKRIHEFAHSCGVQRGERKVPTPMVLEQWGTIWNGACGFGWVFLPDASVSFAKWAIREKIGYASYPGVRIYSKMNTQSAEMNRAYATGYAEVLKANGINCRVESRLD